MSQWWTKEVQGDSQVVGKIEFSFRSLTGGLKGKMVMEVCDLNTQNYVQWSCIDGPDEWIGTVITFELSEDDNQTIVSFSHKNWHEATEFTAH